jgi:hypothetical protein
MSALPGLQPTPPAADIRRICRAFARDQHELERVFTREVEFRSRARIHSACLLIDIDPASPTVRLIDQLGASRRHQGRDDMDCLFAPQRVVDGSMSTGRNDPAKPGFDLVMSCHTLSFLPNRNAIDFLHHLRQVVSVGGLLFLSAFGKYSALADDYPDEDAPLDERFFALGNGTPFGFSPGTRLCLYSERELCNTLFAAGWSVIQSSTSTDNNVLATAVRI